LGEDAVLREREATASAEVGRRVFIEGLAATGALVGSMAVAVLPGLDQPAGEVPRGRLAARGFTYDVVASSRDRIGGGDYFGYNNDFTAYFPLRDRHGDEEWLLWVNHEYADPFFIHGNPDPHRRYARRITATSPRIRMTGAGIGDPGNPAWAPVPNHT
jgi:hypothetical protein